MNPWHITADPPAGRHVHFNLSHCEDVTLIAVSSTRQLGIDVEKVRDVAGARRIAEEYFTAAERGFVESARNGDRSTAFATIWTRREATAKAMGLNLDAALSRQDIPVFEPGAKARFNNVDGFGRSDGEPRGSFGAGRPGGGGTQWFLQDLPLDPGHVGAICVEGDPCAMVFHYLADTAAGR